MILARYEVHALLWSAIQEVGTVCFDCGGAIHNSDFQITDDGLSARLHFQHPCSADRAGCWPGSWFDGSSSAPQIQSEVRELVKGWVSLQFTPGDHQHSTAAITGLVTEAAVLAFPSCPKCAGPTRPRQFTIDDAPRDDERGCTARLRFHHTCGARHTGNWFGQWFGGVFANEYLRVQADYIVRGWLPAPVVPASTLHRGDLNDAGAGRAGAMIRHLRAVRGYVDHQPSRRARS